MSAPANGLMRRLSATLVLRIAGGAVAALPPIYALAFLDRAAYGAAITDVVTALLLAGPVIEFIVHGYLRGAITAGDDRAPEGSFVVFAYTGLMLLAIGLAWGAGLVDARHAGLVAAMLVLLLAMRLCESELVLRGRQAAAILLVYVVPPTLVCLLMAGMQGAGMTDDFAVVAIAQVMAATLSVAAVVAIAPRIRRRLLPPSVPSSWAALRQEFGAVGAFASHGMLLSASEPVPVLVLGLLGHAAAIPGFELARKIASVPLVVIHALNMHLAPRMIGLVQTGDLPALTTLMQRSVLGLTGFALAYGACAAGGVALLPVLGIGAQALSLALAVPLLLAATVGAAGAPFGIAGLALGAERWWVAGGIVGLSVECALSLTLLPGLGAPAVAWAVVAQTIALQGLVALGTVKALRHGSLISGQDPRALPAE